VEEAGPEQSTVPGNGRTPIVPDNDRPFFPKGMDQSNHIAGQLENIICLDWLRPIRLAVATLIWSHYVESRVSERWKLVPPGVPALWKAMTEDDQRALALFNEVHLDAIRVDEAVVYCCHSSSSEAYMFLFRKSLHQSPLSLIGDRKLCPSLTSF